MADKAKAVFDVLTSNVRCPKCGKKLPDWAALDSPFELARMCAQGDVGAACQYVPCDDMKCRALAVIPDLKDYHPTDASYEEHIEQLQEAVEHWKSHRYMSGCSHGN